jgi:hypothetical protein
LLNDLSGSDSAWFLSNSLPEMNANRSAITDSDSFDNLGVVLFVGCKTADGGVGGNNLPSEIVAHGAAVAVGFEDTIGCSTASTWTTAFYDSMMRGLTVQASVNSATEKVRGKNGLDTAVIVGESYLTIYDLC